MMFGSRKTRATRKAEAKALKTKARAEAREGAKSVRKRENAEIRRAVKADKRTARETKRSTKAGTLAAKLDAKSAAAERKAQVQIAEANARVAAEGRLLSVAKAKRYLAVSRVLAPVLVPIVYRGAVVARERYTELQADRYGVPPEKVAQFSAAGARLSGRIAAAEQNVAQVSAHGAGRSADKETAAFVTAMTDRLSDLGTAVAATERMPAARRRAAHAALSRELDAIDADLLARLGVRA